MKTPNENRIRIVIVDDHQMFREQLAHLVDRESDMMICGQANNVRDGAEKIRSLSPDLAIIDITLKGANGLALLKDLRAEGINVPTLVLSMHDESIYAERALRAGANGYITKHEASDQLLTAIRHVMTGQIYLKPEFMARMVKQTFHGGNEAGHSGIDRLTDRELEVFELIGQGKSPREIRIRLNVGATTIDTYRARIKEKLSLENAAHLHTEAVKWVQQREALNA